ncbi:hypothetical protein GCM10009841_14190 [Microlunatus panaciterrae]|uniref:Uncharacterized protein with PQ loop repeat n=1 Tax=Microlunatus panaciterrae TaxID=400768 RepID=A0ABS2RLV1_9ACTN|nr:hypothetical protein [Microlunatus panaciterrae]MBM7799980.1 uncharacterized protein with PQ loop repeat [Microlunatus panaciterrae]
MIIESLGWAAGVYSACVFAPQVIRLLRSRTSAGVSVMAWQTMVGTNLAWASHGVLFAHPNIWLPNLVLLSCVVTILGLIRRDRQLSWLPLLAPGLALGAVTVALDVWAGPLAFAIAAFLPSAIAQLVQFQLLVNAPNIRGVSLPFLFMNVLNQVLWFSWAVLAGDESLILVASAAGVLMLLNCTWGLLRRFRIVRARLATLY